MQAYAERARTMGHEVRIQQLGNMKFDPVLWQGYKEKQQLEADLIQAQENIIWCNHWVIVYPMWWGSVPALLKGFLDRVLLSGFAYKYHKTGPMWDKLLKGRTAALITTSDAPWWWIWLQYGNADLKMLKKATLGFCGFSPVKHIRIDRVRFLTEEQRKKQIERVCATIAAAK
jgi:putative NADPH-quinone reductase